MPVRIAAAISLICFAACLVAGVAASDNPFEVIVWRGLQAMFCTFLLGLVAGHFGGTVLAEVMAEEDRRLRELRDGRFRQLAEATQVIEVSSEEPEQPAA